jgi:hypothetical protein
LPWAFTCQPFRLNYSAALQAESLALNVPVSVPGFTQGAAPYAFIYDNLICHRIRGFIFFPEFDHRFTPVATRFRRIRGFPRGVAPTLNVPVSVPVPVPG